jgi:hypothetical protein
MLNEPIVLRIIQCYLEMQNNLSNPLSMEFFSSFFPSGNKNRLYQSTKYLLFFTQIHMLSFFHRVFIISDI